MNLDRDFAGPPFAQYGSVANIRAHWAHCGAPDPASVTGAAQLGLCGVGRVSRTNLGRQLQDAACLSPVRSLMVSLAWAKVRPPVLAFGASQQPTLGLARSSCQSHGCGTVRPPRSRAGSSVRPSVRSQNRTSEYLAIHRFRRCFAFRRRRFRSWTGGPLPPGTAPDGPRVTVQTREGRAQSQADVGRMSPVPAQMWAG